MRDLALLIPSRGRPHNITNILDDLHATDTTATLILGVDEDDPTLTNYQALTSHPHWGDSRLIINPRGAHGISHAINATYHAVANDYQHYAFMGDDVRIRTPWQHDTLKLLNTIGAGVVYWNDLHYGKELCTHWAVTGNIPATLGNFVPPTYQHLYVDNFYMELGQALNSLYYLPHVVIEHMHALYDKSVMDDGYAAVNNPAMYARDYDAHNAFMASSTYNELVTALKPLVNPQEGK